MYLTQIKTFLQTIPLSTKFKSCHRIMWHETTLPAITHHSKSILLKKHRAESPLQPFTLCLLCKHTRLVLVIHIYIVDWHTVNVYYHNCKMAKGNLYKCLKFFKIKDSQHCPPFMQKWPFFPSSLTLFEGSPKAY